MNINNPLGTIRSFGMTPPVHGFNDTEGLTTPSSATGYVEDWRWGLATGTGQTYTTGRSWLEAGIMDDNRDTDVAWTEITIWVTVPEDFKSWDTIAAASFDTWASVAGWGRTNGTLSFTVYDTAGNSDYVLNKNSWSGASTWETVNATATNLNGTYTKGKEFRVMFTASRLGTTSTPPDSNTMEQVRVGRLKFKYNAE